MNNRFFLFLFLILIFITFVFSSSSISADRSLLTPTTMTVEYHGGQLNRDSYNEYTAIITGAEDSQYAQVKDNFKFDLKEGANKNRFALLHLNSRYDVQMEHSTGGKTEVIFTVSKNGVPCKTRGGREDGRVIKKFERFDIYTLIDDYVDFCGISFRARWLTMTFQTDVRISDIWLSRKEYQDNINNALRLISESGTEEIIRTTKKINRKFRVIEINSLNDFSVDPSNSLLTFIHSKTQYFNKHDNSGKMNGLVITQDNNILYFIFLKSQASNEWVVYAPEENIKVDFFESYNDLKTAAILEWTKVSGEKVPNNYHFTSTNSVAYNDSKDNILLFNYDPQFWSRFTRQAQAKINFLTIIKQGQDVAEVDDDDEPDEILPNQPIDYYIMRINKNLIK